MSANYYRTFAIGGISCSVDSFLLIESSVLRMNIRAKNIANRESANTLLPMQKDRRQDND
jgi:hypothetical protein